MNQNYGRDFDLNLLRVFVVVAEAGSVTAAAGQLYLTQPAVSAALRRLRTAVGAPLFVRAGRGLALTERGRRLLARAKPHLGALVDAALHPAAFAPKTSERTVRLGLSDASESWILPPLLRALAREAPRMRLIVLPVQFRTVATLLAASRVDIAVTVADELPAGTQRQALFSGGFVCLFDPARARLGKRPTLERYLAHEHVVVSYNGDLRGIVEDLLGIQRRVRVSVPSFQSVGAVVEGTALLATVPESVAREITLLRRGLQSCRLPFSLPGTPVELLWPSAVHDDEAIGFVRRLVTRVAGGREMGA
mgnify:CR=1 FL=1